MKLILLTASTLLFVLSQNLPVEKGPLRNSFVTAAEAVLDSAAAIDVTATDSAYSPLFTHLQDTRAYLDSMAEGDRELGIASNAKDIIFFVSACRLQAKNGASTDKCLTQLTTARIRMMQQLNRHKSGELWVEGPPAAR